ncbi:MAG: GxGYxYP family putative glycoside hydrolase [Ktedonobacteraceae bacterium]
MNNDNKEIDIDWSGERVLPAFQAPRQLKIYDMRTASHHVRLTVATLVGLINRPQPQVYLLDRDNDTFWLKEVLSFIPQEFSNLANEAILADLLSMYRHQLQGFIIYDPALIDSINIATMLAAQQDGIIVSPVQAQALRQPPYELPMLADLRTYKWNNRVRAYRWAQQHLLSNTTPRLIAGLNPQTSLGIRPFLVATRTFIYWLDSRNFLPNPAAGWISERALMRQILRSYPVGAAHLGWFVNEGTGVMLTSLAAKPVFASDFISNLEVWTSSLQVKRRGRFIAPIADLSATILAGEPTKKQSISPKIYLSFTLSEGDNLQYIQEFLIKLWRDPARGSVPIGWTISPALVEAAPAMAAYYTNTATPNDELIAAPSGAGYIFPSFWPAAQLPQFLQRTGELMQRMHLTILEVLDVNIFQNPNLALRALIKGSGLAFINKNLQRRFVQGLSPFGVRGILSGAGQCNSSWNIISGMPIYQNAGIVESVSEAVSAIKRATPPDRQRPYFLNVYILAWRMTPSDLKQAALQLGDEYEVVTPGRLLAMLAEASTGM